MPDAKNDAGCCLSRWRTTDCTTVFDANFCPTSIFLHQAYCWLCEHLSPYTGCTAKWILFA